MPGERSWSAIRRPLGGVRRLASSLPVRHAYRMKLLFRLIVLGGDRAASRSSSSPTGAITRTRRPCRRSSGTRRRRAPSRRTRCFACHSNLTEWPWYASVAPVSWLTQHDVEDGRAKLNFSEWQRPQEANLEEVVDVLRNDEMPPRAVQADPLGSASERRAATAARAGDRGELDEGSARQVSRADATGATRWTTVRAGYDAIAEAYLDWGSRVVGDPRDRFVEDLAARLPDGATRARSRLRRGLAVDAPAGGAVRRRRGRRLRAADRARSARTFQVRRSSTPI